MKFEVGHLSNGSVPSQIQTGGVFSLFFTQESRSLTSEYFETCLSGAKVL